MSIDSLYRLDGRVAVVTGAERGIGATIAEHLLSLGATVVLADRSPGVRETAQRLDPDGKRTSWLTLDVTDSGSLDAAAETVVSRHGQVDILAANAGISYEAAAIDHTDEIWRRALSVNLDGSFYSARAFARPMLQRGKGAIVLTSSIAGVKVVRPELHVGYDVAKAGVAHMTRVLGIEWAKQGLRVNAVGPGYTDTEMLADVGRTQPEVMKIWLEDMPNGRLLRKQEIASAVAFLASDAASGINGHVLMVDAGYSIS
ncbi:SDR family oxidoreductase [Acidisoma cellulosilytica]|uniref:SDR family oxidoreductase n=1 Tax=Acidisoma cellulosilyticum TaxID=2802395 RepID=A0A963Z286_9PROT|nr:SDR family oxidoreductase [Acidisoma cellulosilyticum]MCB8881503.1 SDR family oxidoreductase [Acidisoma cellulosilyticum]